MRKHIQKLLALSLAAVCGCSTLAQTNMRILYADETTNIQKDEVATEELPTEEEWKTPEGYTESGCKSIGKFSMDELREFYYEIPAYNDKLYSKTPTVESGNYEISVLSQDAYEHAEKKINLYRLIAGLEGIHLTETLNTSAAYGALVNAANNKMSHYPDKPDDMDVETYAQGRNATLSSNLSYSYGYGIDKIIEVALTGQMADKKSGNIATLGHRRWLIEPSVSTLGIGVANRDNVYYTAVRVFGTDVEHESAVDYDYVAWPASGNNINDLFSVDTPWSVTLNPKKYQNPVLEEVKVKLTSLKDGKTWNFDSNTNRTEVSPDLDYFQVNTSGYGVSNCIIFRPSYAMMEDYLIGDYDVEITGIKDKAGNAASIKYRTHFEPLEYFDLSNEDKARVTIEDTQDLISDGMEKKPAVQVSYKMTSNGYKTLVEGRDYVVTYANNVDAGTATVTVTGMGTYTGSVTKEFTILAEEPMYFKEFQWSENAKICNAVYACNKECAHEKSYAAQVTSRVAVPATYVSKGWTQYTAVYKDYTDIKLMEDIDRLQLSRPQITKAINYLYGVQISWNPVEGANGYRVYRRTGTGAWKALKTVPNQQRVSFKDTTVNENGTQYQYRVYAYLKNNGKIIWSPVSTSKTIIRLKTPTVNTLQSVEERTIDVAYDENTQATGYQIRYQLDGKNRYITIPSNTELQRSIKNLVSGKSYKINVRSYKKVGKNTYYSGWSGTQTIEVK